MNFVLIDVGGTKTAVLLAKDDGGVPRFLERKVFITADYSPAVLLEKCCAEAERQMEKHGAAARVGVCCGGPLDEENGVILSPPNLLGWDNIPLKAIVESSLKIPCEVRNDANACAVAEWLYGAGKGTQNMIFMTFGTGLGAGLVLDGKLYKGSGSAGEVGHIRLKERGPVGYGRAGTAEGFCSGGGIEKLAATLSAEAEKRGVSSQLIAEEKQAPVSAKRVAELASSGDVVAQKVFQTSGKAFGKVCAVLIDLFAPEVIAVGGVFSRARSLFEPAFSKSLAENALYDNAVKCTVAPSKLGDEIGNYACFAIAKGEVK